MKRGMEISRSFPLFPDYSAKKRGKNSQWETALRKQLCTSPVENSSNLTWRAGLFELKGLVLKMSIPPTSEKGRRANKGQRRAGKSLSDTSPVFFFIGPPYQHDVLIPLSWHLSPELSPVPGLPRRPWFSEWGPPLGSTWELVRNPYSQPHPRPMEPETLGFRC